MVMHGLAADPKKAESVKDLFKLCDKNGDGEVTKEELCQVFKELKLQATEEELENLFEVSFGTKLSCIVLTLIGITIINLLVEQSPNRSFKGFRCGQQWHS